MSRESARKRIIEDNGYRALRLEGRRTAQTCDRRSHAFVLMDNHDDLLAGRPDPNRQQVSGRTGGDIGEPLARKSCVIQNEVLEDSPAPDGDRALVPIIVFGSNRP
jgi:hypothetical protein